MQINIISLFPDVIKGYLSEGVVGSAFKKNILNCQIVNPREFATDNHKSVDDKPFGGTDGMLLKPEIFQKALDSIIEAETSPKKKKIIYMSAQGKTLKQTQLRDYLKYEELILISGRYAGIDNRFLVKNDIEEISIGDYVLSGGELPILVFIDALARLIPGVLGNPQSSLEDSFENFILEPPMFTRPSEWENMKVPPVLTSGNHANIKNWEKNISFLVTLKKRPDLILDNSEFQKIKKDLVVFYNTMTSEEKRVCGILDLDFLKY